MFRSLSLSQLQGRARGTPSPSRGPLLQDPPNDQLRDLGVRAMQGHLLPPAGYGTLDTMSADDIGWNLPMTTNITR
jgi:hypothetical protein